MKKLSYKNKFRLLIAGLVFALILVYKMSIAKTVECYKTTRDLEVKLASADQLPSEIGTLERKLKDLIVVKKTENIEVRQQALLNQVTSFCNNNQLLLRNFSASKEGNASGHQLFTQDFTVDGSFVNSLRLIHLMEKKNDYGNIKSVSFQLKKDLKLNEEYLYATVYLQTLKSTE